MKNVLLATAALAAFACGSKAPAETLSPKYPSVQDHLDESQREQAKADSHQKQSQSQPAGEAATSLQCTDDPLESVSYSGGERYKVMRPCWTSRANSKSWHQEEEKRHRKEAAAHRAMADALIAAEGRSCGGLGASEVSQSPLTRGEDILSVQPIYDGKTLLGATIVLRKVKGLSASWLEKSLACHRARAAALGYPTKFMADCPMSLPKIRVKVSETSQGISVRATAARGEIAAAILGRAQETLATATK